MNEEREFADREWWRSAGPLLPSDVVDRINRVYFELDAERAHSAKLAERVAELEQMYAEMKDAADKGSKSVFALAAEQAENARLREALVDWADANDALRRAHLMLGMEDKQAQLKFRAAADKLMVIARSSPSSNAALREVCRRVAQKAWDYGFIERGALEVAGAPSLTQESHAAKRAADVGPIVSSILGPEVKP